MALQQSGRSPGGLIDIVIYNDEAVVKESILLLQASYQSFLRFIIHPYFSYMFMTQGNLLQLQYEWRRKNDQEKRSPSLHNSAKANKSTRV